MMLPACCRSEGMFKSSTIEGTEPTQFHLYLLQLYPNHGGKYRG
jgi:hypothetical protein